MPLPSNSRRFLHLAVGIWAAVLVVILIRSWLQPHRNTVYPIFATAAREWTQGVDMYDITVQRVSRDWFRYAPIVAVALTPFAVLPDALGSALWRVLNLAVFIAGGLAFARAIAPGQAKLDDKAMAFLALLTLPLCLGSLNNAQANLLVIGCLMGATAGLARQRWQLAAACLAVSVLFKIYPLSVAALLLLVQPQFGWRLGVALVAGCLAPFAFQDPTFVAHAYESWVRQLASDHRHDVPVEMAYRDFHVLTRALGVPLPEAVYRVLQLAMAALVAAVVLSGHWRDWSRSYHLRAAFDLGCCWMILFGPATENATYSLLGPTLALAGWESLQNGQPVWKRWMAWAAVAVLVSTSLSGATPWGKWISTIGMPVGALLVFAERLHSYCVTTHRQTLSLAPIEPLARAA